MYLCLPDIWNENMLTKNTIRFIQSLEQKKCRNTSGCFLAEGNKLIEDTIGYFSCCLLIATKEWLSSHEVPGISGEVIEVSAEEMGRASLLKSPQDVLAVYRIPQYKLDCDKLKKQLVLALDTVQDPGNLGTIVRMADWYGIGDIICSPGCADVYNPKTVQATMGAITRVRAHYTDLKDFFDSMKGVHIYGTFLDGENIYEKQLTDTGIIIMGNEGNGISPYLEPYIGDRLYLPCFPPGGKTSESLNVAVATAITCAEFRRRQTGGK